MKRLPADGDHLESGSLEDRLDAWLNAWQQVIRKPHRLMVARSTLNVLECADRELQRALAEKPEKSIERSELSWCARLARTLKDQILRPTYVFGVLERERPQDVARLRRLLCAGKYSVKELAPAVRAVKDGPSAEAMLGELVDHLQGREDAGSSSAQDVACLLLRGALRVHSVSYLRNLPEKSLTQHAVMHLANSCIPGFVKDEALRTRILADWWEPRVKHLVGGAALAGMNRGAGAITGLFEGRLWSGLAHHLARQVVHTYLRQSAQSRASTGQDSIVTDPGDLGRQVATQYFECILLKVLHAEASEGHIAAERSEGDVTAELLGESLRTARGLYDRLAAANDIRQIGLYSATFEAGQEAVRRTLASLVSRSAAIALAPSTLVHIGEEVTRRLEPTGSARSAPGCERQRERVRRNAGCTRFHSLLRSLLAGLEDFLEGRLKEMATELPAEGERMLQSVDSGFWTAWVSSLAQVCARGHGFHRHVPWGQIGTEGIAHILGRLRDDLFGRGRRWDVTVGVQGLAPDGSFWWTGDVLLYDSRTHDFGEGIFPDRKNWPFHAWVSVEADTGQQAAKLAHKKLDIALDLLSFAASAREFPGGFRPNTSPWPTVIDAAAGRVAREVRPKRAEFQDREGAGAQRLDQIGRCFDQLAGQAHSKSRDLTEVQAKFLQAAQWYRRGRWEVDDIARFLAYWIGLEHIGGTKGSGSANLCELARVAVTCHDLPELRWLNLAADKVVAMLPQNRAAAEDSLSQRLGPHPRDRPCVLEPSNVDGIRALQNAAGPDNLEFLRQYEAFLSQSLSTSGRARTREALVRERESKLFELKVLRDLRNRVMHEAFGLSSEAELLADEAESILENVLWKMAAHAGHDSPVCLSIEDLVDWSDAPFI